MRAQLRDGLLERIDLLVMQAPYTGGQIRIDDRDSGIYTVVHLDDVIMAAHLREHGDQFVAIIEAADRAIIDRHRAGGKAVAHPFRVFLVAAKEVPCLELPYRFNGLNTVDACRQV
jgi:hypothetical protein